MRSRRWKFAIAFGVVAALFGSGAPAGASDEVVAPGDSIQAAIDDALPGDTVTIAPGVFHENLTITTDDITLRGAGSGRHGTVLMPASMPTPSACPLQAGEVAGICVLGDIDVETGSPISDVTIEDLTVDGFPGTGIYARNAVDYTVAHVRARNNGGYGIAGFFLSGVRYLHSVATDNADPGIYIGDSHDAQAVVLGNTSIHNGVGGEGFGFLLRDSSNGVVIGNHATRNCIGFHFIDSGFNLVEPLSDWTVRANTANRNNGACAKSPEFPAFSGTGILLGGTHAVRVRGNHVFSNRPSLHSSFSGGIVVASTLLSGGADPTDNVVSRNVAFHNKPADIVWDLTGTGNRFRHNLCARSLPPWICDH